ncbi:glucose-dependent insulinotropic receptor-like [Acanthaster planci]|uniref:Glucose-dependent insulinotropic receptor-like n=1 Tax=Acanthaster planci TaxID=133434 RepID=A0A8B7Y6N7_ACAPL|nr:glucose-dependent insulinotropic receptor-like [Acanthaster planci]
MSAPNNSLTSTVLLPTNQFLVDAPCATQNSSSDIGIFVVFLILGILIVIGNVVVLVVILKNEVLLQTGYSYIISLTVADLLVGINCVIEAVMLRVAVPEPKWCLVRIAFLILASLASILSVFGIAYDRYIAITNPMVYTQRVGQFQSRVIVTIIWIVALLIGLAPLMGWSDVSVYAGCCQILRTFIGSYMLFLTFACYIPPLLVQLYFYSCILQISRNQARRIADLQRNTCVVRNVRTSRTHKALKTLTVVIGCFVLTWTPFFVALAIHAICAESCNLHTIIQDCLVPLGFTNSFLNPFVYAFWSRDFRESMLVINCCTERNRERLVRVWTIRRTTRVTVVSQRVSSHSEMNTNRHIVYL